MSSSSLPRIRLDVRLDARALGVGLAYSFASLGVVQKYANTAAALVLFALAPVVGLAVAALLALARARLSERTADILAAALLGLAVAVLLIVYPHANTHAPDQGSDRDDAATIGARGFLHGENPYGSFTYLHNPVSQLPTLLVVAMPFAGLFGSSAYELVLFAPLLYLLWRRLAGSRVALVLLLVALVSPTFLRDFLTGGDLMPNTVLVAAACVFLWNTEGSRELAAAALLGVALASRANFAIVLIPLLVALARRRGARAALRAGVVVAAVFATIVLPFALTPGGRTALSMNDKLSEIPGGAPLILVLASVLAVALALPTREWTIGGFFAQAAIVQAAFLVAVVVNTSVDSGRPDFFWLVSGYGVPTLLFALTSLCRPRFAAHPLLDS